MSKKPHCWDSSHPPIIQTGRECPSEMEIPLQGTTAFPRSIAQALTAQLRWGNIRAGPSRFSSRCFALFNVVAWAQRASKVWNRICQHRVPRPLSCPRIHAQRSGLGLLNLKNTKNLSKHLPPTHRLLFYLPKWALRLSSYSETFKVIPDARVPPTLLKATFVVLAEEKRKHSSVPLLQ